MRWLADECVDAPLVAHLRETGHDVFDVTVELPGAPDSVVLATAGSESRILLTEDKDFGELVFRRASRVPGLVLLRIEPAYRDLKILRVQQVIDTAGDRLHGRYTVIEPGRTRSRPLRWVDGD